VKKNFFRAENNQTFLNLEEMTISRKESKVLLKEPELNGTFKSNQELLELVHKLSTRLNEIETKLVGRFILSKF